MPYNGFMSSFKLLGFKILSAVYVLAETFVKAFWRLLCWIFFFFGLWLFQIPQSLGHVFSAICTLLFILGVACFIYRDAGVIRSLSFWKILRRIELDSRVKHRPLSGAKDKLIRHSSGGSEVLWARSRKALHHSLLLLKKPLYSKSSDIADPLSFRLATFLFFGFGLLFAGPEWNSRLAEGLMPAALRLPVSVQNLQASIEPPSYTGLAPLYLGKAENGALLKIPQGSKFKVLVQGGIGKPVMHIGDRVIPMGSQDQKTYTVETDIPNLPPGKDNVAPLSIRQMFIPRAHWVYQTVPDLPPHIEQNADVEIISDNMIRIPLLVQDDYSVEGLKIEMDLDPVVTESPLGERKSEIRSVMSPPNTAYDTAPVLDYSSHIWAGLPVLLKITALDHLGQNAELPPIAIVLPEKEFQHPIAKKLIALRKKLAWNPTEDTEAIAREIEEILFQPSAFHNDLTVFLALRSAASRLYWNEPAVGTSKTVISLLWDTALAIEDGNLSIAMRDLRDAQNALERALRDPSTEQTDIAQLMNDLRQAMADYMNEMQRELQKRMQDGKDIPMVPPEMLGQVIDPDVMNSFLDQLEQEMRSGNKDKVQEMLSQLQEMMDGLSPQMAEMPEDMQMMQQGANELQQLIERQESLLEQTQNQISPAVDQDFGGTLTLDDDFLKELGLENLPPPENPQTPQVNTAANKAEQEALRLILGQLMLDAAEVLKDIPPNMGKAEQEMRGSSYALGENNPQGSVPHQEEAIRQLKEAQKQLSQQFMARMKQLGGMMMSRGSGMRYDPLGRPYGGEDQEGGMNPGSSVKIPNDAEAKRALEILRELRRRSSQRDRPENELEYYRRLLKQF